ncbi:MBL fold metallo-hydrolase [Agrobacterium sp. ICMP 6402]|uniref:MBL fold metallo-hydrolase n=1 Tax=Agrobacterium sp. ICMP 6402 TaxID=2292443 RepID=UPI0012954E8F|nr:MBL fold metallo-hydrolase [Agrobacterium sp. ICMP 6402]
MKGKSVKRMKPEDWYAIDRVADDVTLISEPHIKEFYRCNIWHVRGRDKDMLVDSGMGVVDLRAHVPLLTGRPICAVCSHTHFDHIGGHHEFDERVVHRCEETTLANPDREATLATPYVTDDIFTALPPVPYDSTTYRVKAAPATRLVEDGDVIDLGDRHFEVIHTPGHSPGGIALWESSTGILFSGDIVYDGELIEDTYHADAADYRRSMERLLQFPVTVVHGGHFPSYGRDQHIRIIRGWLDNKQ